MPGMGPPPKPNARQKGRGLERALRTLPAAGRPGPPPPWPLGRATKAEQAVWVDLWTRPQAVAWEALGVARTVARYCRTLVQAEKPGAPAAVQGEARQLEDRLGLSPMAMLRLRWEIASPDEAVEQSATAAVHRLRAVE